jgi:hypothetical protein
MTLEDLGSIGEFVAALATVGTLVYLAIQIRSNTRQMRGQAFVSLNDASRQIISRLHDDPSLDAIVLKATADWSSLSVDEQRRATYFFIDDTNYFELAFMLWQQGAIDEQTYATKEAHLITVLMSPGRRYWWDEVEYIVDPRFRRRIDSQLAIAEAEGRPMLGEKYPMYQPHEST